MLCEHHELSLRDHADGTFLSATKLVDWTSIRVLAWPRHHVSTKEVLFLIGLSQAVAKLMLRLEQHRLHSVAKEWRRGNLILKSTPHPSLGADTKNIGGVTSKGEDWLSLVAQLVKNPPAMQETLVQFLGGEEPLEKGQATHSHILGLPWWLSW